MLFLYSKLCSYFIEETFSSGVKKKVLHHYQNLTEAAASYNFTLVDSGNPPHVHSMCDSALSKLSAGLTSSSESLLGQAAWLKGLQKIEQS